MTDAIDQMIDQYLMALRSAEAGQWEAAREGGVLGLLLIRNVQAVVTLARHDEIMATAAWSNARVAFEHSVRITWMLYPADRYEAECRWLAFLEEHEKVERKIVREASVDAHLHSQRAEAIRQFREAVISALPAGYRPARVPNLREMLAALDSPQMYRLYQEGSQYVHGSLYAISSYSKHLGNERIVGDFTSIVDWILPLRLCWLSLREATRLILDRLDVPERVKPNWTILNKNAEAAFQALISSAERSHGHGAEREAKSGDCEQ